MRTEAKSISNRRKAAVMMMLLGAELSGKVMKFLENEYVEALALEIARIDKITPEIRNRILHEFHQMAIAQDYIAEGGVIHAKKMLESAFGPEKADQMISWVSQTLQGVPFDFLRRSDPAQLATFLQEEHPQTVALVLAYLPPALTAQTISQLNPDLRVEVAERVATLDRTPPEVIKQIENVLRRKLSAVGQASFASAGGVKALVNILHHVDRGTERTLLEALNSKNPELATEILNMMFVFEDIVQLDDRTIQQILREVETKELSLALKGTSEEVQAKIFRNMSERAASMVKEDMEFMGPVKLKNVEDAQQRIVAVIRRLEEAGEISLGRGEEEMLV